MALVRSATESSAHTFLQETLAEAGKRGFADAVNVPTRVLTAAGPAAQALIDASDGAALLVVGSRGRGAVRSALLGSTALHCVTHARCPVLVVGDDFEVGIKAARIVVGVDGSDVSKAALRAALDEARRRDADVEVVSVFSPVFWAEMYALIPPDTDQIRTGVQQRTEETVREVLAGMDGAALPTPRIHTVVVEGVPSDVLESQARNASLLVVGNQGQAPVRGLLLGSVALHCVMHAPCPVLVVRVPTVREQPTSVAARSVVAGEA
jgi:nucleotide-binding universal stress UspA family protein